MLPGIGIFGSDPISKVLIQILRHLDFEVHSVWTNHYDVEIELQKNEIFHLSKVVTTSIDNVLLNKSVNLVFVCCQPNLHSQICTKALGTFLFKLKKSNFLFIVAKKNSVLLRLWTMFNEINLVFLGDSPS